MTKKVWLPLIFFGSSLLLSLNALAMSNVSCTPAPTTVNTNSAYTVNFRTGGSGNNLVSGVDTISITFPNNTIVPGTIAASQITVSTGTPTAVTYTPTIVGQTLTILTPINVGTTTNVAVVINTGTTNLTNPSIAAATYKVAVTTSQEGPVNSSNYTIAASATAVSVGSVTVTPATIGNPAAYSFNFNTSADGFLWGGNSHIVITFPGTTSVPNGALSNITVGGAAVTSATGSGGNVITLVPSADVANSASNVTVSIPTSTGLVNPTATGSVQLTVSTSAQPVGNSTAYSINTFATGVTGVTTSFTPSTIGNYSAYTIGLTTDATHGALVGGTSTITITFPSDTAVFNGAIANVLVNGSTASSATGNSAARTVTVVPASDIAGGTSFTVVIPSGGSAVRNPTTVNTYNLQVHTSPQPTDVTGPNYSTTTSGTGVVINSVTLGSNTIANFSQYTINMTTDSTSGNLVGGTSQIVVTFPVDTLIAAGAIANCFVNGSAATATGVTASRTITLVPSVSVAGGTAFNVVIPVTGSAIRNPTTANNYNLQANTTPQPTNTSSPAYTISTSGTPVTINSVTPSPTTVGSAAQYTINLTTDSTSGYLIGGSSQIVVTFPSDTTVVTGGIANVMVNGAVATSAVGASGARTVTIVPSASIPAGTAFNIVIPSAASAIHNPTTAGSGYTLTVHTTPEPSDDTSPTYTISASSTPVTINSVTPNPTTAGSYSQYTINITTDGTVGALVGGSSQIVITFPSDTNVVNGGIANVMVNGNVATSANGASGARTVTIVPSTSISAGSTFNIVIPSVANAIRNPTTAGSSYTLSLYTTPQPTAATSPTYTISTTASPVNINSVTPSPTSAGSAAQYTISLTTDATVGALVGGSSQIVITFPSDTNIVTGAIANVIVSGAAATSATGNNGARTITIVPSASIIAGATFNIVIPSAASAIHNPSTAGSGYVLQIHTTPQPVDGSSAAYTISASATPVTINSVTPNPTSAASYSQYTINLTTDATTGALTGGSSQIVITFPLDTVVANGGIANVTVNGVAATSATGSTAARTVTVVPSVSIAAGSTFNVVIPSAGNAVRNPTTAGNYTLNVHTTPQPTDGTSGTYTITTSATPITVNSVTPSPTSAGSAAQYTINITTDATVGALVGGSSQIVITFPSDTNVVNGAIANVTVNGAAATSATGNNGARTVTIVPSGSIAAGTTFNVFIPSAASAIHNPSTAGGYTLAVHTTPQPTDATSGTYTITASGTPITVNSVTLNPTTIGNYSQYTINLTTNGTVGALVGGSSQIVITFPADTAVFNGAIANVTVNGAAASSASGNSGTRVVTIVPSASIPAGSTFNVVIPSTANNVRNPTTVNSYSLAVHTTPQPTDATSPNYSTTTSATQITINSVAASPAIIANYAQYTISLTTDSTTGDLIGGTSQIVIAFPADTAVFNGAIANVLVNGAVATSAVGVSATRTITITPSADIAGGTTFNVVIPSAANNIRNPTTTGSYTLTAHTTPEPTNVTSPSYSFTTSASAISITSVTPSPTTVGNNAQYTVVFTTSATDGDLAGGASTITLVFPVGTNVHNGALTNVTVNGTAAAATGVSATQIVTVTVPADIAGGSSVSVVIPVNTPYNLQNPITAQSYSLTAHTSTQPTVATSPGYSIVTSATPPSITSVTPNPATIGNPSQYTVVFSTDATNGGLGAGTSQIVVTFPSDTLIPTAPIVGVTVNGVVATSATGNGGAQTITLVPSQDVSAGAAVTLVIPSTGVRNPTAANTYNLQVNTTSQPNNGSGGNYSIGTFGTAVTGISVVTAPTTIGNYAQYTVSFTSDGTHGYLVGGNSQIVITFPAGTVVANGAVANVTVNGVAATSAVGNNATNTITVVPSNNITGGTAINVIIPVTANTIRNPTAINNYTLQVHTSPQPTDGTSSPYSIGVSATPLTVNGVTVAPSTVGNFAAYTFSFNTAANGGLVGTLSTISVTFPAGTLVPTGSLSTTGITVNGTQVTSANGAGQTITLTVTQDIAASTNNISVVLPVGLNIRNPTTSGNTYQLSVATSVQTTAGNSGLYSIGSSGSTLVIHAVTVTPSTIGNLAAYSFSFDTSSDGALVGGTSQMVIVFPGTTSVPNGALANITVNGQAVTIANGSGGSTITLTIPGNIAASTTNIPVVIPLSVGVRNPTIGGAYTLQAATTPQPTGTSPAYNIGQSSNAVTVTSVTPTPNTVGSDAGYAVNFNLSSDGPLIGAASHIVITFPDDTVVPAGGIGSVTVNGTVATSATGASGPRTIDIVPTQSLAGSASIAVIIPAVLHNPTYASAGNTLTVSTTVQPAGASPAYSIVVGGPVTLTMPNPTPNEVNVAADYTINLTLSVVQRANKGQIFIYFPASAQVFNGAITGAKINGVAVASATGIAASSLIVLVPNSDLAPGTYAITLPNTTAIVLNPSTAGTNMLYVRTTAEGLGSASFTLNPDSTPSNNSISKPSVANVPDSAGGVAQYTISFNVAYHGRLNTGNLINLQFPAGTGVPASFAAGTITINGVANTGTVYATGLNVELVVPAGVAVTNNGGTVTVVFTPAAGIVNPATPGYSWQLTNCFTDAEPTPVLSAFYMTTANSHITQPTVVPNPAAVFANASYAINFNLGVSGSLTTNVSSIFITFPSATTVPTVIAAASVTVNGVAAAHVYYHTGNMVEIVSPVNVSNAGSVGVFFSAASGLVNPSLPGVFTLLVHTTLESLDVVSLPYTIGASTGTTITKPQVDLFPAFTRSAGRYKINFSLGTFGGLVGGTSTINVIFPNNVQLPASVAAGMITVNGQVTAVPATSAGHVLTITVPLSLGTGTPVELIITSHSGIVNPPDEGDYTLSLYTSSEPTPMVSNTFHISTPTWSDIIVYPNPITKKDSVNKVFTFFLIPSSTATLKVYTLDGRLVKTITKNDNTDKMVWDLNNDKGSSIASGIYLYVITGNGGNKKGKLAVKN